MKSKVTRKIFSIREVFSEITYPYTVKPLSHPKGTEQLQIAVPSGKGHMLCVKHQCRQRELSCHLAFRNEHLPWPWTWTPLCRVVLGGLLHLSKPQFLHLQNRGSQTFPKTCERRGPCGYRASMKENLAPGLCGGLVNPNSFAFHCVLNNTYQAAELKLWVILTTFLNGEEPLSLSN